MDVYEAVTSRRAVRGFTDQPVPREVLERVLSAAAWSPSGSNIQPWNIYVMTGAPLAELKTLAVERVAHGDPWDERQYEMYPPALKSPYGERRSAFGKERYGALGIAREDWEARKPRTLAKPLEARAKLLPAVQCAHHLPFSRDDAENRRTPPAASRRTGGTCRGTGLEV